MAKPKIEIIRVKHGVANRFQDCIEVHEDLHKYPRLYYPIMRHELGHSESAGFTLADLKHDLNSESKVNKIQLLKFMCKHPKTFTQVLPFYYTPRRKFVIDINLTLVYSVLLLIGWGIYAWLF